MGRVANYTSQSADSVPARVSSSEVDDDGRVLVNLLFEVPVELLGEVRLELGGAVLQPGGRINRIFLPNNPDKTYTGPKINV